MIDRRDELYESLIFLEEAGLVELVPPKDTVCTSPGLGYIKAMKTNLVAKVLSLAVLFLAIAFLAGCKTTPSVNWDSRVGVYTYNQAVADMGPPDKQSKRDNGDTTYQWITLHGGTGSPAAGTYLGGSGQMGGSQPFVQTYKDHVLELTFGPDGKLVTWAKNY